MGKGQHSRQGYHRFVGGCALALTIGVSALARADAPDAVWAALKEREVVVETSTAAVRGKLIGVDPKTVVILKADGSPVSITRGVVKGVRAALPETPSASASTPVPAPSAAAATSATDPSSAPSPTADPAAAPEPPPANKKPAGPELDHLLDRTVSVRLIDGERVSGRLMHVDGTVAVLNTRDGTRRIPRDRITSAAGVFPAARVGEPASQDGKPTDDGGDGTSDEGSSGASGSKPGHQGRWLSADLNVIGVQHSWLGSDRGSATLTALGPTEAPFNFGIGYQTSSNFLIGSRFGFQVVAQDGQEMTFSGKLAVRLEALSGGDTTRGFLAFEPAFAAAQQGDSLAGAFSGAISAGAHIFAGRNFSIDPFGELGYQRIFDLDVNVISLRGGLMLSGWIWN